MDIADDNNGTLHGDTTFASGMVGQAFAFDGLDDSVRIPHALDLNPTASLTIDAWIFPTTDGWHHIVAKWGDAGAWSDQRAYTFHTISGRGLLFGVSDDANQNNGEFHDFQVSGVLSLEAWNHVAAVYDQAAGTRFIYVNGVEVARRIDAPISLTSSIADLGIGAVLNEPGAFRETFPGLIDEVEIYNRALSAAEIQAIFNAGSAGKCKETEVQEVTIDIKPGSSPNSINAKSHGVIPVAILTTDTFDATTVDPLSVEFGPSGASEAHGKGHIQDVNHDGEPDLVLHFRTQETGIECGDTSASLTGETVDGEPIQGSDSIKTVGCKK